jgi:hypothetical protein
VEKQMGHFSKVVNNIVEKTIVAEPDFFNTFVDVGPGQWLQVSYNTYGGVHYDPITKQLSADQSKALRGNYPGIGYIYSPEHDVFYAPQPFPSWVLNESTWLWEAPTPMPTDGKQYKWEESSTSWIAI